MKRKMIALKKLEPPSRRSPARLELESPTAPEVVKPASLPYGLSYEEWAAKWWQWSLGQATNHLETVGVPGICEGPASQVPFLAGIYGFRNWRRNQTYHHSHREALFFSILSFVADNTACPVSDFTSLTGDQLTAEAVSGWNSVTDGNHLHA